VFHVCGLATGSRDPAAATGVAGGLTRLRPWLPAQLRRPASRRLVCRPGSEPAPGRGRPSLLCFGPREALRTSNGTCDPRMLTQTATTRIAWGWQALLLWLHLRLAPGRREQPFAPGREGGRGRCRCPASRHHPPRPRCCCHPRRRTRRRWRRRRRRRRRRHRGRDSGRLSRRLTTLRPLPALPDHPSRAPRRQSPSASSPGGSAPGPRNI